MSRLVHEICAQWTHNVMTKWIVLSHRPHPGFHSKIFIAWTNAWAWATSSELLLWNMNKMLNVWRPRRRCNVYAFNYTLCSRNYLEFSVRLTHYTIFNFNSETCEWNRRPDNTKTVHRICIDGIHYFRWMQIRGSVRFFFSLSVGSAVCLLGWRLCVKSCPRLVALDIGHRAVKLDVVNE